MIPVDHHTYAQTQKPRCKLIFACFCIMLYIGLSMKRVSSWDVLPLAHATSEGSGESAHPLSLARGITAHTHNEGACLSPTRWLCIIHQSTPQQLGGGGGGGGVASRGKFIPVFFFLEINDNGQVWVPCPHPLYLRPYQSFKKFEFTLVLVSTTYQGLNFYTRESLDLYHPYQLYHEISHDVPSLHWCRWYKIVIPWVFVHLYVR